ncbi:MAG TPA: dihydrofolate reductase family protein [Solirubrobacteraceae bacterium]
MAKLIYLTIASLDGYVADEDGKFDWAVPDEEVHAFVNDLARPIGTELYGRRLYEVMIGWETMHTLPDQTPETLDFAAIWQAAEKVVYSRTLKTVSSARTRIEPEFDPEAIRRMKAEAERDISIGGATLAAEAIRAGLVDELHVIANPIVVGGGLPSLPGGVRWELELLDERRFANGAVYLRYRTSG